MLALLFASLLAAAASASPTPVAAAPAAAPGQPLRQVTYKVTQGTRTYSGAEHYAGFSSSSTASSDQGTVAVSVVSAASDVLLVSVTETMNSTGRPVTNSGSILPDGSVNFGPDAIHDVTRQLLEYFGTQFQPKDKLVPATSWDVNYDRAGVDGKAHYTVTTVEGDLLTLAVHETLKIAAQNINMTMDGTVVMKPSLLVPVHGDLRRTIHRMTVNGDTETQVTLQFQRVSDSLDPSAH